MDRPPAPVPEDTGKALRCCTGCKLVKTVAQVCSMSPYIPMSDCQQQFYEMGCENGCFGEDQQVEEYTTTKFSGYGRAQHHPCPSHLLFRMISVLEPEESWAAKWLHCCTLLHPPYTTSFSTPTTHSNACGRLLRPGADHPNVSRTTVTSRVLPSTSNE